MLKKSHSSISLHESAFIPDVTSESSLKNEPGILTLKLSDVTFEKLMKDLILSKSHLA